MRRPPRSSTKPASPGVYLLTEAESKQLLAAYGIPTVPTFIAATADEAVTQAEKLGYPVVLKLHSETVTHKTDVGGVQLDLKDAQAVRSAFEKIRAGVESGVISWASPSSP